MITKGKSVRLLDMAACKEGTAETLFNNIDSIQRENKEDWENCVAGQHKLCCWAVKYSGKCREKEFHHDTGIDEERKYTYKWLLLPHNPQHCKQGSGRFSC